MNVISTPRENLRGLLPSPKQKLSSDSLENTPPTHTLELNLQNLWIYACILCVVCVCACVNCVRLHTCGVCVHAFCVWCVCACILCVVCVCMHFVCGVCTRVDACGVCVRVWCVCTRGVCVCVGVGREVTL